MNNDLISRSELRARFQAILNRGDMFCEYDIIGMLDNAPTIEVRDNFDVGYVQGLEDGRKEKPHGEWVRKEDVIHSIAKQYSEHNELVPIWLSIGDLKGGADNE